MKSIAQLLRISSRTLVACQHTTVASFRWTNRMWRLLAWIISLKQRNNSASKWEPKIRFWHLIISSTSNIPHAATMFKSIRKRSKVLWQPAKIQKSYLILSNQAKMLREWISQIWSIGLETKLAKTRLQSLKTQFWTLRVQLKTEQMKLRLRSKPREQTMNMKRRWSLKKCLPLKSLNLFKRFLILSKIQQLLMIKR